MQCPIHNQEFKLVPAGISKTSGKAYQAFWACPERGCKQKPQGAPKPSPVQHFEADIVKEKEEMKWQEIGAQKNRSNLAAAWIQSNRPIDDTAYRQLAMMEGFVLNGKVEVKPAQPNTPPLIEKIKADPKYQDPKQVTLEQQKQAGDDVWGDLLNQ